MILCAECKHYGGHFLGTMWTQCDTSKNFQLDYDHGGVIPIYEQAQSIRQLSNMCGPEAKWFEPKEEV